MMMVGNKDDDDGDDSGNNDNNADNESDYLNNYIDNDNDSTASIMILTALAIKTIIAKLITITIMLIIDMIKST